MHGIRNVTLNLVWVFFSASAWYPEDEIYGDKTDCDKCDTTKHPSACRLYMHVFVDSHST